MIKELQEMNLDVDIMSNIGILVSVNCITVARTLGCLISLFVLIPNIIYVAHFKYFLMTRVRY